MIKYLIVFLVFNLTISAFLKAQLVDRRAQIVKLLSESRNEWLNNVEKSLTLSDKALKLSKKLKEDSLIAESYSSIALCYSYTSNCINAIVFFDSALLYIKKSEEQRLAYIYNQMGSCYGEINQYELALKYLFNSLSINKKYKDKKALISDYGNIGVVYINRRIFDSAIYYFNKVKEISVINGDTNSNAFSIACLNLGLIYTEKSQYLSALKEYQTAKEAVNDNNIFYKSQIFLNLGITYYYLHDHTKAKELFTNSNLISKKINNKAIEANSLYYLGRVQKKEKEYEFAIKNLQESKNINKQIKKLDGYYFSIYELADIYLLNNQYSTALEYFKLAYNGFKNLNINKDAALSLSNILYINTIVKKNYDLDLSIYLDSCFSLIENTYDYEVLSNVYYNISLIYKNTNNELSKVYMLKSLEFQDSLLNSTSMLLSKDLMYNYQSSNLKLASDNLAKIIQLNENEFKNKQSQSDFLKIFLIAMILIVIIITIFSIYIYISLVKIKRNLYQLQLRNSKIKIYRKRLIVRNNKMLILKSQIEQSITEHLGKLVESLSLNEMENKVAISRINSIANLYKILSDKKNLSEEEYFDKIIKENIEYFKPFNTHINLVKDIDQSIQMKRNELKYLGLIINEVLINTLKYAFGGRDEGTITIKLFEEDNYTTLSISDNGVGYDVQSVKKGFGNKLIEIFTKQLKGNLLIKSDSLGSYFNLTFSKTSF
jgi:two-component sensor histidine kinase